MIKTEDMTDGLYYVKEKHGVEVGDWDSDHKKWNGIWGGDDTEVLAEVPSYEEWQKHRKTLLKTQEKNCDLEIINTQLKELLKECKHIMSIEKDFPSCSFEESVLTEIITKINQVLGEE